ncbi:uncharacterized protein LOC124827282 [Vigna umbellata]|uniref:uncharacterized protein LOC124827282 n=1 Tax=Vigna umbellata TaxID=87088 RepID=UPI001F5E4132|nr:uncharacterized protein LOC124827282 [Vigna umbellata]
MVSFPVGGPLEIYLHADMNRANLSEDWKRTENISLALINQVNDQKTLRKGSEHEFSAYVPYSKFIFFDDFNEPSSGFIVNDTCMIEVGIFVMKNVYENEQYWTVRKIDKNPDTKSPLFQEMFMRSFPNIDLNYVPLLEKVKDMDDDEACNHLKKLWDEVEIFGFDLSWLKSDVKSALNLKNYTKKTADVRKAKAAVIERETELERAKRELVKAEEGFEERNLDDILGYGRSKNYWL